LGIESLIALLEDLARRNKYRSNTDSYKSELQTTYEEWYDKLAPKLAEEESDSERDALIVAAIATLLTRLKDLGRTRLMDAYELGFGDDVLDDAALAELGDSIAMNDHYLDASFGPYLRGKVLGGLTIPIWMDGLPAIKELFSPGKARVGLYAGEYWEQIWKGAERKRIVADQDDWQVAWVLDPQANHCPDCLAFAQAYINYDVMLVMTGGVLPGAGTACDGNCRCTLFTRPGPGYPWEVM